MVREPLGSGMVATTREDPTSTTDKAPSISALTKARFPSEVKAMSRGRWPTGMRATTSPVAAVKTVTS